MIDAKNLLGTLLQAGVGRATHGRIRHAAAGAGGLGELLGQALGGAAGAAKAGAKAGARPGAKGGGVAGGSPLAVGGLGALAGAVLGGQKGDLVRGAIGGGALALLGKLAYDALQERGGLGGALGGAGTAAAPASPSTTTGSPAQAGSSAASAVGWGVPATPAEGPAAEEEQASAKLLLQAMLSAAKADGQIDGNEMQRILGKLDEAGSDADSKGFLLDEMRRPSDVDALARQADTPHLAAQVYAASLLAIDVDTEAERDYLRRLAGALALDRATVGRLHAALGVAPL